MLSLHTIAANLTKVPELALADEEARSIAKAVARVSEHYDIAASEKTLAWVNLAMIAGSVYGPRILAYELRKKAENDAKKAKLQEAQQQMRGNINLHPFPGAAAAQ